MSTIKTISLAALTTVLFSCGSSERVKSLAQCLNEKGVTVYGTEGCSHCTDLKDDFGSSMSLIRYVDCYKEPKECIEKGIRGVPTIILGDGTRIEGYRSLEKLAEKTGCEW